MQSDVLAKCIAIANSNYANRLYDDIPIIKLYEPGGIASKATGICHYCSVDVLKSILEHKCLRFSDVRFLNDSTEFMEIIWLIEEVISDSKYRMEFRGLILESGVMNELREYEQSYIGKTKTLLHYEMKKYRTYTCSLSTDRDSLNMWNYYAASGDGVNICFDYAWNMFDGSEKSELNSDSKLEDGIIICRGVVVYNRSAKKMCVQRLLDNLQEIYEQEKARDKDSEQIILWAFKESVNNMRCFFKNEAFECENEYRVVLKIPEDIVLNNEEREDNIFRKGQFKRGNIWIPYVDYKLKKESMKEITINPYENSESVFKLGIKEMLWQNELNKIDIVHSGIPIRKYN